MSNYKLVLYLIIFALVAIIFGMYGRYHPYSSSGEFVDMMGCTPGRC